MLILPDDITTEQRTEVEKLKKSIELIINSGIDYEFRTTIVKSLTSKDDLRKIAKTIQGAKKYFLQKFINEFLPPMIVCINCTYVETTTFASQLLMNKRSSKYDFDS